MRKVLWETPGQVPSEMDLLLGAAFQATQRALQERSKGPPREPKMVRDGPRALKDAQDNLWMARDASDTPQESPKRTSRKAPRAKIIDLS